MDKNRIRELRKQKHITQVELADKLGVSQAQVARLEAGINDMNTELMRKLAVILDVKVYELLPIEEQPEVLTEEEKAFIDLFRKSKANNNPPTPAKAE